MSPTRDRIIGPYTGQLAEDFCHSSLLDLLVRLPEQLRAPHARVLRAVRNLSVCLLLPGGDGQTLAVAVKAFARPSRLRSGIYRLQGSKARRSWRMARFLEAHRIGTPRPIGFLERWSRGRLEESYYLSLFQAKAVTAHAELMRLVESPPGVSGAIPLIEGVARAVRQMHRAGLQHNDLSYQNILIQPGEHGGEHCQFIDLNRARIRRRLSLRQQARDISRLWIPDSLRTVFDAVYFDGAVPPMRFQVWERIQRAWLVAHGASRNLRHPLRARRRRLQPLRPGW